MENFFESTPVLYNQSGTNHSIVIYNGNGAIISIITDSLIILGITGTVDMSSAGEVKVGHS